MDKRTYKTGLELTGKRWHKLKKFFSEPQRSPFGGQVPVSNPFAAKVLSGFCKAAQETKIYQNTFRPAMQDGRKLRRYKRRYKREKMISRLQISDGWLSVTTGK
jgi:hypothetical protein